MAHLMTTLSLILFNPVLIAIPLSTPLEWIAMEESLQTFKIVLLF
jgi:hypothetical protein